MWKRLPAAWNIGGKATLLLAAKGYKDLKRDMFDPYSTAKIAREAK